MAGNGFPRVDLSDLVDLWALGNMAQRWARQPVALGPDEFDRFQTLAHRYGMEPAEVLMKFQKIEFGDRWGSGPHEMPEVSGAGVPYPSPHPRHDAAGMEQSPLLDYAPSHLAPSSPEDGYPPPDQEYLENLHGRV